jgi:protein involved in polysaccharide export with SLBB domain
MFYQRFFLLLSGSAVLLGTPSCNLISEAGPLKGNIRKKDAPYQIVEVKSPADIPSHGRVYGKAATPPPVKGQAYSDKIRVRDSLEFVITDVSVQSPFHAAGAYRIGPLEVPEDGLVGIPYAGEIQVLDLSLSKAASDLEEKLKPVSQTARVSVNRSGRIPLTANVLGEVGSPGPVILEKAGMNSHDLLAASGGPKGSEHLYAYSLRRGSNEYQFDYLGFRQNPFIVEEGDMLTVTTDASNRYHVMGAINRPVSVSFPLPSPTLADALGSATGLDERRSDPSGLFVFRKGNPDTVYTFNMKEPSSMSLVQRFPIQGEDIIYITEAPLVRWNRMLTLILPGSALQVANSADRLGN